MPIYDITESTPFDLTSAVPDTTFNSTNTAYDLTIDDIPFIVNVNNQNQYRRETAQYKKDQFDSSVEPGEQSLSGWWLRSQTSWHNGAGIKFYEPGTDYQHVSHRFAESRGIDIWDIGEAKLLPKTVDVYTGNNLMNAAVGWNGTGNCLVTGDSKGLLKKVSLNDDSDATVTAFGTASTPTLPEGHSGTNHPFSSVTSDGTHYYATCPYCIHSGAIATANSDRMMYKHSTTGLDPLGNPLAPFISYVKGYLLLGSGNVLTNLFDATSTRVASSPQTHGGVVDVPIAGTGDAYRKVHLNDNWKWNSATASPGPIYVSGNAGNNGEIWAIGIDEVNDRPDMPAAKMVGSLPFGETVIHIHHYLGFLAVGTSKGLRICSTDQTGNLILGPLLYEGYPVTGFTTKGNYIYGATMVDNDSGQLDGSNNLYTHACAIRVDLSAQFDDGTFAWAYDLEYESTNEPTFAISAKSLTTNVATITTSVPHGLNPLNDVIVSGSDTTYRISNKSLTSNVATITTLYAHGFTAGNTVTVTGVDTPGVPIFDGAYTIIATPTSTTFTYAKVNANVASTAVTSSAATYASSTSTNSIFNGSYTVVATPTPTTFTYAKTNANVLETTVLPRGSVREIPSSSWATEVYELDNRIVLVVDETGLTGGTGELHAAHTTLKRGSGWLKTGVIRFATVEPKWFRYINVECKTGEGDTIGISVIDERGVESDLVNANQGLSLTDILIVNPETAQKSMAFKFTLNNVSADSGTPILESYQIKASPATRRQRLIQYPLSCFDREMDKYGSTFGYDGRAKEIIDRLEALEETSRFVTFTDYRTNESFVGLIEDVKFSSESSPDKNSNGFGGVLIVTVRKL